MSDESESSVSHETSQSDDEGSFAELMTDELEGLLKDAQITNDELKDENEMLERYLFKVDPDSLNGIISEPGQGPPDPQHLTRTVSAAERMIKLTADQKCEIALWEIEQMKENIEKLKKETEKVMDSFKAMYQEADIRSSEIQKGMLEFDRDVVRDGVHPRTGEIMGEKVERYFRDKMHHRKVLIEKLRLKVTSLRSERQKIKSYIRQKEEIGEFLHPVDFDQLQIENQQCLSKIESKNQELLELKCLTCNITQNVNSCKKKLNLLNNEAKRMAGEMRIRNDLMRRVQQEAVVVKEERQKAKDVNEKLKEQLGAYRVPPVMNYVKCVEANKMIETKNKSWERKLDIAKMALRHHRRMWQSISKTKSSAAKNKDSLK